MKFEHQISKGTYVQCIIHGPETEGLYCFYCTTLKLEQKMLTIAMRVLWSGKAPKVMDVYMEAMILMHFLHF